MARLRVVLADDHPPTRAGVRAALEEDGFVVVGEAADAKRAVELTLAEEPNAVLLDIHMPGNGISAATKIAEEMPEVAVVMLTVSQNDQDLFESLRAGASGYLLKDTDPGRLSHALRGVLAGEAAIPRQLVSRIVQEFRGGKRRRISLPRRRAVELTSREAQVLELLRQGLTTAEMAERLFVSKVTVRSHVASILKKLHVPDREAAVRLFQEEG